MFHSTGKTMMILTALSIGANLVVPVDASVFLHASHSIHDEHMSEQEVQMSLLAEIEGTFGEGSASSRAKQFEAGLATMYAALPKNEHGYLGHATVRYALHRLFVQRHGWFIKGLHAGGRHRNSTTEGLLKEQVPAYLQELLEQRLGGRGFGLHELAVLGATIEHLVHNEAIKRLGEAFRVHSFLPTSIMRDFQADSILDTYMMSYILGEDLSNMTHEEAAELLLEMPDTYNHWKETQDFVRAVRRNITDAESSSAHKASGEYDFSIIARVAERVGEKFGSFQDQECSTIKARLLAMEERGTGRVRLSDFHSPAEDGHWQFGESVAYLRQLGALDESDALPRVIIPNYVSSSSNCIASSAHYSVCCIDECEGLLGHLEEEISAPEATPEVIAGLVGSLSSSSVTAPRELPADLVARLDEIAAGHGGMVNLHGRLFAQWMHHAYPRECPYPHVAGTTNPLTPDEYEEVTGKDTLASEEEMQFNVAAGEVATDVDVNQTFSYEIEEIPQLPWSPEEELLIVRPPQMQPVAQGGLVMAIRNVLLFTGVATIAYRLVHTSHRGADGVGAEKYFV